MHRVFEKLLQGTGPKSGPALSKILIAETLLAVLLQECIGTLR